VTVVVDYDAVPPLVSGTRPLSGSWPSDETSASARLAQRLQRAYIERVQQYKRDFDLAERQNSIRDTGPLESGFPAVELVLDGVKGVLRIDETLYTSLFELYAFYGWEGVLKAQVALARLCIERMPDASNNVSWPFFLYTRNLLVVLIRETLIELEGRAAQTVFDKLGPVQRKLSAALLNELAFAYKPGESIPASPPMEMPQDLPDRYVMKNAAFASALFERVTKAVEARQKYNELVGRQSKLREQQQAAGDTAVKESGPRGGQSGSASDDSPLERRKRTDAELLRIAAEVETALGAVQKAQDAVFAKSPFALVAVPGLARGFSQEAMEDVLGRMLIGVARRVDEIASVTRPGDSRVARHLDGLPSDWQGDTTGSKKLSRGTLEHLYPMSLNLEFELADSAAGDANSDAAISWLLDSRSWRLVMAGGTVEPGSFEHIVLFNWVRALGTYEAESARSRFGFSKGLATASAALSLIAIVLPPVGVLGAVAAVALMADAAHSAARRLADVDRAIAAQLPALNEPGEVALAELGGLLAMRTRVVGDIATETLVLLATLGAASQIRAVAIALQLQGYLLDVSTLLHAADEG
jgi:hypothetical protein